MDVRMYLFIYVLIFLSVFLSTYLFLFLSIYTSMSFVSEIPAVLPEPGKRRSKMTTKRRNSLVIPGHELKSLTTERFLTSSFGKLSSPFC